MEEVLVVEEPVEVVQEREQEVRKEIVKMTMKETIEGFKKRNGNEVFTQKEMIMYVISKIDGIDERLAKGAGKICSNRAKINGMIRLMLVGLPLLCAAIGWLFIRTV